VATIATGIAILWSFVQGSPAALLFIVLALTSLFLFTKSDSPNPSPKQKMRNVWYTVCGWAILTCKVPRLRSGFRRAARTPRKRLNLLQSFDKALYDRMVVANQFSG
jgi:hypothetical protein